MAWWTTANADSEREWQNERVVSDSMPGQLKVNEVKGR